MKAFPRLKYLSDDVNGNYDAVYEDEGMDLRDYFAAKAMQFLINKEVSNSLTSDRRKIIAKRSYKMADTMMEARK